MPAASDEPTNVYITALNDQGVDLNDQDTNQDMDDEQKILEMYSQEEIENFRMIFIMFDPDKTGFVGVKDLETILKSLGRDPDEATDLVADM